MEPGDRSHRRLGGRGSGTAFCTGRDDPDVDEDGERVEVEIGPRSQALDQSIDLTGSISVVERDVTFCIGY